MISIERRPVSSIPGSWCPFRTPQFPGAKVPCDDTCALFISTSKLPKTHSCAITVIGVYALQRVVVPEKTKASESRTDAVAGQPED